MDAELGNRPDIAIELDRAKRSKFRTGKREAGKRGIAGAHKVSKYNASYSEVKSPGGGR